MNESGTGVPLVSGTTYNAAGAATAVTYGNTDTDVFAFDSANRPSSITNTIQAATPYTMTTTLTWNPNSSLKAMAIADTNDPTKNQTCTYAADDLGRLASVNCGTTTWAQTFTYDPFGNINKASVGNGTPWVAAYNALTNQVSNGLVKGGYDANGNQLSSTSLSQITWTAGSLPASVTDLNNATHTAVYDALGRAVESNATAAKTLFLYGASGAKVAKLVGGTLIAAMVPLTGGETAVYNASGLQYLRHTDWLGSSRLATTWAHAVYSKESYAPFGETYNEFGTADRSFTGQEQDTVTGSGATGTYDFPARSYDPAAGRWLSPDPLGWGAASAVDPQSLNRYSYVENMPMVAIDPSGLACVYAGGGTVSVDNTGGASGAQGICEANGGSYYSGWLDLSFNPKTEYYYGMSTGGNYVSLMPGSGSWMMNDFNDHFDPMPNDAPAVNPTGNGGGSGGGGITKMQEACLFDVGANYVLGYVPGYNAAKLLFTAAGGSVNFAQNYVSGKSIVTFDNMFTGTRGVKGMFWGANALASTYNTIIKAAAKSPSGLPYSSMAKVASTAGWIANTVNTASAINDAYACKDAK